MKIVCVDPNAHAHNPRVLENGQSAAYGEEIDIDDAELAASLLEQEGVWAKPSTNAAKDAAKHAKRAPEPTTEEG